MRTDPLQSGCWRRKKFCDDGFKCRMCDKTFDSKKSLGTTSFHQIKKDLTVCNANKATMIVDLGCPNSVLGISDVNKFKKSLSHFQQKNLEIIVLWGFVDFY